MGLHHIYLKNKRIQLNKKHGLNNDLVLIFILFFQFSFIFYFFNLIIIFINFIQFDHFR